MFASAVRFPAVAKGEAIVRFMLMATHTDEHIERTLTACAAALNGMEHSQCASLDMGGPEHLMVAQSSVAEVAVGLR